MEFQHWLHIAEIELTEVSSNPRHDAEILLMYITGRNRAFILAFGETKLTSDEMKQLNVLLARRNIGEPIAYIIGEREFWSLPFYVSKATLIPRPDTECLVEQLLIKLPIYACRILDLGTGSGAVALAIARERPDCEITAVDLFPDVIVLAQRNITRLGLNNVILKQSYWFSALNGEHFKFIVSNPPYVDEQDFHLTQGDVQFEPRAALIASDSGLSELNYIISHAKKYLYIDGWLLVEHGWKQGKAVRTIFSQSDYKEIVTCCDYSGNERVTLGKKCY